MLKVINQHRFLLSELIKRDFKKKYKRTVLGMAWSVLSPLFMLLVMRLVFTRFFGNDLPHYTTYLFCGNLVFSYFTEASGQGMSALVTNSSIFTRINVPKYLFIISKSVQTLINFSLTLAVFFVFVAFDGISFGWHFLLLLFAVICLVIFNTGISMILSALFVFFKDIQYLWSIFTQVLMYMSAIFYRTDVFSETARKLFYINPLYVYITYFREIVIDGRLPSLALHALAAFYALAALGIGALIYKTKNHKFLYYL